MKSIDLSTGYNDRKIKDLTGVGLFTVLENLECQWNKLTELDLSANTALTSLECQYNDLTRLDVSGCLNLVSLDCRNNQLTVLDLSGCDPEIEYMISQGITVIEPPGRRYRRRADQI